MVHLFVVSVTLLFPLNNEPLADVVVPPELLRRTSPLNVTFPLRFKFEPFLVAIIIEAGVLGDPGAPAVGTVPVIIVPTPPLKDKSPLRF